MRRLIEMRFFPPKTRQRLIENGVELHSMDAGNASSCVDVLLLELVLEEAHEADMDYSTCTEYYNPTLDVTGLFDKLLSRICRQCEPELNILYAPLILRAITDAVLEPEISKLDRQAMETLL
ncbi:hypothetical protein ACFLXE_04655 [Chloroflexota bacterium]